MQQLQSSESFNHIHMNPYSQGHYKQHLRKADYKLLQSQDITNFCSLKKQTLQILVVLEADTTNSCSFKKKTLQIFVVKKSGHYKLLQSKTVDTTNSCSLNKRTLQTFVVLKSGHYKLLKSKKADTTNFCTLSAIFCSL